MGPPTTAPCKKRKEAPGASTQKRPPPPHWQPRCAPSPSPAPSRFPARDRSPPDVPKPQFKHTDLRARGGDRSGGHSAGRNGGHSAHRSGGDAPGDDEEGEEEEEQQEQEQEEEKEGAEEGADEVLNIAPAAWNLRTTIKLSYWYSEVDGFDVLVDLLLSKQHITVIFLNVCEENSYDCEAIKFLEDLCCARNIIRQDIGRCRGQTTSKLLKFISDDKAVERLCPGCYLVCRHEHAVVLADADYGYWCSINELMFSATVQVEVTNKDQSHHDCKNNLALSVVHTLPGASDEDWVEPCTFHTKGGALKVEETFLTAVADDVMTQGSRFLLGFFGDALSILPEFLQMTNAQVGENIFVPWFIKEFNESGAMVGRRVPCPFPLMAFVFGPHGGYTCPDLRDAPHWESMTQVSHMRVAPPVDQHNNVILDTVDATEFIRKLGSARSAWRGVEAILDDTSKHATVACELQKVFQMDAEEMPAVAGTDATFMSWTPIDWDQGNPLRGMS